MGNDSRIKCRGFGGDTWPPDAIRPTTSCLLDCHGMASPAPWLSAFVWLRATSTCSLDPIGSTTLRQSVVRTLFATVTLRTVVAHRLPTVTTDLAPTARES